MKAVKYLAIWTIILSLLTERCGFKEDIVSEAIARLSAHIVGQDNSLQAIARALSAWDISRKSGDNKPLALVFAGATGVGKTESAYQLAAGIMTTAIDPISRKEKGCGYLQIKGQDFSKMSDIMRNGPSYAREKIRSLITTHLERYPSAVIVFDEVKKIAPGILEILDSVLDEGYIEASTKDWLIYESWWPFSKNIPTKDCIFIFIFDMPLEDTSKWVLSTDSREKISIHEIREDVREFLQSEAERLSLYKLFSDVVPFLPLESEQLKLILNRELNVLAKRHRQKWWRALLVENDVLDYVLDSQFIKYDIATKGSEKQVLLSATGGRAIRNNGGPYNDLTTMIGQMQPWRPEFILHIGLAPKSAVIKHVREADFKANGTSDLANYNREGLDVGTMYMQWCNSDRELELYINSTTVHQQCLAQYSKNSCIMKESSGVYIRPQLPSSLLGYFLSSACKTVWYGKYLYSDSKNTEKQ